MAPSSPPSTPTPATPSEPAAWLVTFGYGQELGDCWAWIPGCWSVDQAREKVILVYGSRWAFIYGREEYDKVIAPYPIHEVEFGTPNE